VFIFYTDRILITDVEQSLPYTSEGFQMNRPQSNAAITSASSKKT